VPRFSATAELLAIQNITNKQCLRNFKLFFSLQVKFVHTLMVKN